MDITTAFEAVGGGSIPSKGTTLCEVLNDPVSRLPWATRVVEELGHKKYRCEKLQRYFCPGYSVSNRSVITLSLRISLLLRFDSNSRFSVIDPSVRR